jgi:regulator of chromosome condensation
MDRKAKRGREDDITSPDAKALRRDEDRFTGHRGNQQLTPPPSGLVSLGGFARASPNELARRSYVKQVRVLLLKARGRINMELADWALQQQQQQQRQTPGKLLFYGDATQDYLSKAHAIRSLYERTPGMVASSGAGDCGQLGLGEDMDSCIRPRLIKSDLPKISRVVCGGLHTLGIAANGALYAWGCNDDGSLGRDDLPESTVYTPVQIKGFRPSAKLLGTAHNPEEDFNIVHAAAGDVQTMVVTASGNVYMFGAYKSVDGAQLRDVAPPDEVRTDKDEIQRPDQTEDDYLYRPAPRYKQEFPIHLDMPGKVLQVFCGASFSAALLDDGSVVTWGIGESGELGRPTETPIKTGREYNTDAIRDIYLKAQPPIFLDNPTLTRRVLAVGCGSFHMLLVVQESGTSKRAVYSTGLNNYGQLGLGDIVNRESLTRVSTLHFRNDMI